MERVEEAAQQDEMPVDEEIDTNWDEAIETF
eukprot:CAMPEP_0119260980 /NCGR_PEP_ID=MMETSP1329-20130426/1192_1 /TAXON_ID=114041 /ORGANISM="Genus nov. species nov., Strain RCC1024" /LENGTH=30 /DNA_ID= /DNA_START= /DNA_END= /DNA_ORIENTATION=